MGNLMSRVTRWVHDNLRFLALAVIWPVAAYYACIGLLGLSEWASLLLAAGAWFAGVHYVRRVATTVPSSWVRRNLLWIPFKMLGLPCLALFLVHSVTGAWLSAFSNLAAVAAAVAVYCYFESTVAPHIIRHFRGKRRLDSAPTAESMHRYGEDPRAVRWGGVLLPSKAVKEHVAFVGAPGSGKTLSIRMYLQQLLPLVKPKSNCRALIYDVDQDMQPYLHALKRYSGNDDAPPLLHPNIPVITLNPYDNRGYAWDIAGDVTSDETAIEVASLLFPLESNDTDKFFGPTAQQILRRVMMALHYNKPGEWTFKELVDSLKTEERIRRTMNSAPTTREFVETYLSASKDSGHSPNHEDRQARGIVATIGTRVAIYEPIAELWDMAIQEESRTGQRRRVSLKEWSESEMVLLLGTNDARTETLSRINQVLFNLAAKNILSQEVDPTDQRRSLIVLDEVRRIQKLDKLDDLLTNGRKRGVGIILGFQDIEGMRHAYQTQIAHEVIAQCGSIAFFRMAGETAKWAESFITNQEAWVQQIDDSGKKISEKLESRPVVSASELSSLPKADPQHGLQGWYSASTVDGVFFHKYEWEEIMQTIVTPSKVSLTGDDEKGCVPREIGSQQPQAVPARRKFHAPDASE